MTLEGWKAVPKSEVERVAWMMEGEWAGVAVRVKR